MAAKLARLTQKTAIQMHLVAESCTTCSRRPVRKLLDISPPSYFVQENRHWSRLVSKPELSTHKPPDDSIFYSN